MKNELVSLRKQTMEKLSDFYRRLPDIKDPIVVVIEFQEHVKELIDYIIALESDLWKA